MAYFEYNKSLKDVEYYEILENLMARWEFEIVEFKEAKGGYDTDKIGRYFSAISNEANLRQQQYGWLIFGVGEERETKIKKIVGTAYKKGDSSLLERFKYEVSRDTANGMTFYDIIEIFPVMNGKEYRVLMFKIPAAATGIPTDWKTNYYERVGESLVPLKQYKIDAIRSQERRDWSKQVLEQAKIEHLDKEAVALAREKYKEKMNQDHISKEVDAMNDEQFLTKIKLMINGKITHAGMLLLGNSDFDYMFQSAPSIMWTLYGADNIDRDYAIFKIPFINVVDKGFDDKYYKDLIVEYLNQYGKAKKKDVRELLWDKLPDALSDAQKEHKVSNLLAVLKKNNVIDTDSPNQQRSYWILRQ